MINTDQIYDDAQSELQTISVGTITTDSVQTIKYLYRWDDLMNGYLPVLPSW